MGGTAAWLQHTAYVACSTDALEQATGDGAHSGLTVAELAPSAESCMVCECTSVAEGQKLASVWLILACYAVL